MNNERITLYPVFVALVVALGGFLLGFDGVVNGGAVPFYRVTFGISDTPVLIGLSTSAIILGAIFGNFSVGFILDKVGRKPALLITSVLFMIGAGGTALAPNIGIFIFSKLIAGLGVGIAILVAPMYIAEIAPPKHRGWLVTFNQLNIVMGLSIAMLSNYYILNAIPDPDMNWRWMLGVGFFPALVYFVLLFLVPESPRWLIQKGKLDEGLAILTKSCGKEEAQIEYDNIRKGIVENAKRDEPSIKDIFTKSMRTILFIGFGLAIFQQLSGINAVLYYAPMIFESAGSKLDAAFLMAIVVGLVFTIATVVSMFLIDKLGRRPLLIMGCAIMTCSFLVVSFAFHQGTYRVDDDAIQSIYDQSIRAEITAQTKLLYPNNYLVDSTVLNSDHATMYQNGSVTGTIAFDIPAVKKSKRDAENLVNVLTNINGVTFRSETAFFDGIKTSLLDQYNPDDQPLVGERFSELYKPALLKASIDINNVLVLLGILGFITGFSISLGPVMWAMFSEIFPSRIRSKAIAIVGATNAFTSFIVATLFPMELEYLGSANTYLIFGIFMMICLGFVIKYIPETKGKSLEQLELELIKA